RPLDTMELLRAALEPVNQGVIFLDEECVPFYANSRARQILEAASTSEVHEVLERGGLAAHIMGERGEQEGVFFIDVAKAGAAKAPLLVGFEARELSPISRGRAYLVLMHDFSEWRKLDELHSRFATYLSHRMRTPLTSARNAVTILSGKDQPLEGADRERFLEIGCRNIEKLISSFDELQKVFMVESGEINAYRSLVRVGRELGAILGECERSGLIRGFKLRAPDCTAITCRSRLKEYVLNTVEAMASWLGEVPHVDCTVADTGTVDEGVEEPALFVSLVPRGRPGGGPALKDYLALEAVQRRFVLERIARALDGVHTIAGNDTFKLRLPAAPPFDRERDLIHPLHMMLERSELERSAFHLVSMRLGGAVPDAPRFTRLLEANLCALFGKDDWVVAREEAPERFALFVTGASREGIDEAMEILRERFAHCCRERGEEIYPTVRWEISYSREPGACSDSPERAVLEALI
ncbi:MAG TPA: histidine kinase dimerization/phospho-acceptor domain-containing protein, partial [Candidatus Bathyarchaeia archaeon]|nr:histidine kinase dimerization/phospho-acceptor domain-containing protein [Candidatus Bathyarchaeia archaeon]